MLFRYLSVSSRRDLKNNKELIHFFHLLFTAQGCQSKEQLTNFKEKLYLVRFIDNAIVIMQRLTKNVPVLKLKLKILSLSKNVHVLHQPSMKYYNLWGLKKLIFQSFKMQRLGFNIFLQSQKRICKILVYLLIGEDLSLLLRRIHFMIHLFNGNLTH